MPTHDKVVPQREAPSYEGRCHCGAIGFSYSTQLDPTRWPIRACQCSFCRAQGARSTSDPAGLVELRVREGAQPIRYRFGQRTADFLICRECGVYIAATIDTDQGAFAVVNVNALDPCPPGLADPQPMSYDSETAGQRVQRRQARWTPVRRA